MLFRSVDERNGRTPVLIWFHGGGWVIGSAASSDRVCRYSVQELMFNRHLDTHLHTLRRRLAIATRFIVFNVDYPLAPEHKFPAPYGGSLAAVQWAVEHAAEWGGDPGRVLLAGESAGGTLAASIGVLAPETLKHSFCGSALVTPAIRVPSPITLSPSQFRFVL